VLERKPESVETLYWLGRALESMERWAEALACYGQALLLDPQHADTVTARARLQEALARAAPEPPPGLSPQAAALWRKLHAQEEVTLVILGDSLSFGLGVEEPHCDAFPFLLRTVLQEQFPQPRIRVIDAGVAGDTAGGGLGRLDSHVLAQEPDLVIVQFGGNDSFNRVSWKEYTQNLRQIIARTRQEGQAEAILVTPPMDVPSPDSPFVRVVKQVGEETKTPVADFDTALRQREGDYRGFFPNYAHPNEYGHAIMAQQVYRAFCELLKLEQPVEVNVRPVPGHLAPLADQVPVSVDVKNLTAAPQAGELSLTVNSSAARVPFQLEAGQVKQWRFPLSLPARRPDGRSQSFRLLATARMAQGLGFDCKWLTRAPVVTCPESRAGTDTDEPTRDARFRLGQPHLVDGAGRWEGPEDLTATFHLAQDKEAFTVQVEVTDNHLVPQGGKYPPFNDCVEFFFDLRPLAERGKPFYSPQVFLVFVNPPAGEGSAPQVTPLDAPAEATTQLHFDSARTEEGYTVTLTAPRAFLEKVASAPVSSFGFDLAVDDADQTDNRKAQLMWVGTKHNFGNPRGFGEIVLTGQEKGGEGVRISVW